jgi:site-specific recombinase XerD
MSSSARRARRPRHPNLTGFCRSTDLTLQQHRGLAASTIANYTGVVRRFLTSISGPSDLRLASIRGADITDYIRRHAPQGRTFAAAKDMVTALRPFFQFARYRDYIEIDLAAAVPSVAGWSMASIPRAMPAESVRRLLDASKTWRTPAGLRSHSDICQIVHRAIDRAGIELKVTGAHQLRHALAVDMLRLGGRRSARCCGIAARRPRGGMRRSIWKACARSPCHGAT